MSARNERDLDSIPGLGRFPGEGNGNPLQYSCLENPMDRRSLVGYSPRGKKSQTRLSDFTFTFILNIVFNESKEDEHQSSEVYKLKKVSAIKYRKQ